MENNDVTIQKVPLDNLIDILVDLYNHGVDYIDILGTIGEEQDYMAISFCKEYMSEEAAEKFDEVPNVITEKDITNYKLSDEDINNLI
jgi:hypothetical protein